MTPRLELISIVVGDMEASLTFYRKLGLEIPDDVAVQPHVEIALPSGIRLAWDTVETIRSFDHSWKVETTGARGVTLAFGCDGIDEVDATYEAMVADGYEGHLPPWDAFWGQRYAVLHDPDGNTVDLFAPL